MTRKELTDLGIDSKEIIDAIMKMHGENIESNKAKISELEKQISEKENSINELSEKIKSFDGKNEEMKILQDKIVEYENAEQERLRAINEAEQDRILTENIHEIIGDKEFVNDFTKNSIINQIKSEISKDENKGKGAKDIFESIIKDTQNIFKEPQNQVIIPTATGEQELPKATFKNFF